MTNVELESADDKIIPYQELLGNYDGGGVWPGFGAIIPYQELLGNYDLKWASPRNSCIIPYQELLGNYDQKVVTVTTR